MWTAIVQTPSTGTGVQGDPVRPLLNDVFPVDYNNVTGEQETPPPVGYWVIQLWCTNEVLGEIIADDRFTVLSSEQLD